MITEKQVNQSTAFQEMHTRKGMFVLPNIWDAGSAVVFERLGFSYSKVNEYFSD